MEKKDIAASTLCTDLCDGDADEALDVLRTAVARSSTWQHEMSVMAERIANALRTELKALKIKVTGAHATGTDVSTVRALLALRDGKVDELDTTTSTPENDTASVQKLAKLTGLAEVVALAQYSLTNERDANLADGLFKGIPLKADAAETVDKWHWALADHFTDEYGAGGLGDAIKSVAAQWADDAVDDGTRARQIAVLVAAMINCDEVFFASDKKVTEASGANQPIGGMRLWLPPMLKTDCVVNMPSQGAESFAGEMQAAISNEELKLRNNRYQAALTATEPKRRVGGANAARRVARRREGDAGPSDGGDGDGGDGDGGGGGGGGDGGDGGNGGGGGGGGGNGGGGGGGGGDGSGGGGGGDEADSETEGMVEEGSGGKGGGGDADDDGDDSATLSSASDYAELCAIKGNNPQERTRLIGARYIYNRLRAIDQPDVGEALAAATSHRDVVEALKLAKPAFVNLRLGQIAREMVMHLPKVVTDGGVDDSAMPATKAMNVTFPGIEEATGMSARTYFDAQLDGGAFDAVLASEAFSTSESERLHRSLLVQNWRRYASPRRRAALKEGASCEYRRLITFIKRRLLRLAVSRPYGAWCRLTSRNVLIERRWFADGMVPAPELELAAKGEKICLKAGSDEKELIRKVGREALKLLVDELVADFPPPLYAYIVSTRNTLNSRNRELQKQRKLAKKTELAATPK